MAADQPPARWHETLYRWLAAPLLITVVGATLINFVIPEITAKSENHRRALAVKTSLVREMSEAGSRALTTARLVGTDVIAKTGANTQAPFNAGFQAWQVKRAQIDAELEAYFPASDVSRDWQWYGQVVTDVFFLSATGVEDRDSRIKRLRESLSSRGWCMSLTAEDWTTLETKRKAGRLFRASYVPLVSCALAPGRDIVRRLLGGSPSGF